MLDRLEALAREAADEAEGDWFCPDLLEPPYPPINSTLTARRYMAALDPAAMLKIIAALKAAQKLIGYMKSAECGPLDAPADALRMALAELERTT